MNTVATRKSGTSSGTLGTFGFTDKNGGGVVARTFETGSVGISGFDESLEFEG